MTTLHLQLVEPHWITRGSPATDLCAHGRVELRVGDLVVSPGDDPTLCVSAGGLYLLRTLSGDHVIGPGPDESFLDRPLLPCCGHAMYESTPGGDVQILGCPYGVDAEVKHRDGAVHISNAAGEGIVGEDEWRSAVLAFATDVEAFYASEAPKQPPPDPEDAKGYAAFWSEWHRRRRGVLSAV
jgi:hypothetical protein